METEPQTLPKQESTELRNALCPENHMVKAILTMLFCCLPFGVVSLVYSTKVKDLWAEGAYAKAKDAAKNADKWANIAIICGVVWIVIYSIIMFIALIAGGF